uniref:NAD-binding protein n=1 Tax=Orrella sp. TaxID=1921583 RepID=UPI004048871A
MDGAFLEALPLKNARWVISTMPDLESNRILIKELRQMNFTGEMAVIARENADGMVLKTMGVPTVLYPINSAVDHVVAALVDIMTPVKEGV